MQKLSSAKRNCKIAADRENIDIQNLYALSLPAKRTGALYGAFPYPTKISPEAIALFIAVHTKPGDTIFDGFAGSGTTGLAALLCENPPEELRNEAKRLGLNVQWGARNAVLYELGALGSFVAKTLTSPPNPKVFSKAVKDILSAVEKSDGWMYSAKSPEGKEGAIRYTIWSDLFKCPKCSREITLWDACVSLAPAKIDSQFACPHCHHQASLDSVDRLAETAWDDIAENTKELKKRRAVCIHGTSNKKNWTRPITDEDIALLKQISETPIPNSVPCVEIPWGDLYRRGYHRGISHLHHFYTRRNLIIFGRLWELAERYEGALGDALRFWLLSYNASHATIMTRVVAKSGQKDLVITSAQPGVLYISGLPVEKNLLTGLRRKAATINQAFATIHGRKGKVRVYQRSSCDVDLPDGSIDYVFTDPPFGGNIPYAEINFINEAWLNRYTDRSQEIIVSNSQEKNLPEYEALLTTALTEVNRILRPTGKATLVFHSASADVWNALQSAYKAAGFSVEYASILDKKQGSFKQVTTTGAVRGDPLLLLGKHMIPVHSTVRCVWEVAAQLQADATFALDPTEQTVQRLYSRLVTYYLSHNQQVPLDADTFYQWFAGQSPAKVAVGARG